MVPPLFSRTPTSKIQVFCNQHQVGGRLSRPVTSQIRNAKHGTRNTEHGTVYLHSLVALPHLRFTFSANNTKWEGDFPRPETSQTRNMEHGTRNTELINGKAKSSRTHMFHRFNHIPNPTFPNSMPILNSTVTSSVSNGMAFSLS